MSVDIHSGVPQKDNPVGRDWSKAKRQATGSHSFRTYPSTTAALHRAAAAAGITTSSLCNALARDLTKGKLRPVPGSALDQLAQASPEFSLLFPAAADE